MRRITSALYLDFDNILSGLLKAEPRAAKAWLDEPGTLVDRLRELEEANGVSRALLVRRAYLNPNGWIPASGSKTAERLQIAQYRPALTQAGFEVIDCPTLAKGQKNAADIRMVIDIIDATAGPFAYDEVIIASNDADFTPLLIKLRAGDHRTMILTTGSIAAAYGAAADRCIDKNELVALLSPRLALVPEPKPKPAAAAAATKVMTRAAGPERQATKTLLALLQASPEPVALSTAGLALRKAVGTELVTGTKWFGHRTLTRFVQERLTNLKVDTTSVWDPGRHRPPAVAS